jgi:hypothetical protein
MKSTLEDKYCYKVCNKCGEELIPYDNWGRGAIRSGVYICIECMRAGSISYNRSKGVKPLSENIQCSKYLGCHVAERVLEHVFKNIQTMPANNPGYDFICNKGKKIDVKASCEYQPIRGKPRVQFIIKKNTIADYFLCLVFDNRNDLNPTHAWLIPGKHVNYLHTLGIAMTNIDKFKEYEIDLTKICKCCDKLKGEVI